MKKKVWIIGVFLILIIISSYLVFWLPSSKKNILHLIPDDAVFVLSSSQPVSSWKSFSNSAMWLHLKKSSALSYFSQEANSLDSIIKKNDWLDIVGDREFYISTHLDHDKNQYLYYIDLGKSSNLNVFSSYLQSLLGQEEYRITKRNIKDFEITEVYNKNDRETLYYFFVGNTLVASYTPSLIESVIAQSKQPSYIQELVEVADLAGQDGLFNIYINYEYLGSYINNYLSMGNSLDWLQNSLSYSGLSLTIDEEYTSLTGYTNFKKKQNPYIQAIHNSGISEHNSLKLFPKETPYFTIIGFKNVSHFMQELEAAMEKDSSTFASYRQNVNELEKFLDMKMYDDFYSWMGSEIAYFQNKGNSRNVSNNAALVVSIKDLKVARAKLDAIQARIKKKTPVKIQSLDYKGYQIQYLAMKGLFRPFFGGMFAQLDKPYFAIIEEWLVFSAHPQNLKRIIDSYEAGATLYNNRDFSEYYNKLPEKSAVFCYASLPKVKDQLMQLANAIQQKNILKNDEYISSFSHLSFQMTNEQQTFKTLLAWEYQKRDNSGPISNALLSNNDQNDHKQSFSNVSYEDELASFDQLLINDLTEKKYVEYYSDKPAQEKYEIKLRDGWKHGSFESYYENGETKFKGKYKNDLKEGTWKLYNSEGDLIRKFEFEEGKLLKD